MKLIQAGRIEEALKEKIAQTLSDETSHSEGLPDLEMKSRGEEIFQLIVSRRTLPVEEEFSMSIHEAMA